MIKRMWTTYKIFFDKKINNWTIIVLLVWMFIVLTGLITPNIEKNSKYLKADLTSINRINHNYDNIDNYIYLDWKKYRIYLEESR